MSHEPTEPSARSATRQHTVQNHQAIHAPIEESDHACETENANTKKRKNREEIPDDECEDEELGKSERPRKKSKTAVEISLPQSSPPPSYQLPADQSHLPPSPPPSDDKEDDLASNTSPHPITTSLSIRTAKVPIRTQPLTEETGDYPYQSDPMLFFSMLSIQSEQAESSEKQT